MKFFVLASVVLPAAWALVPLHSLASIRHTSSPAAPLSSRSGIHRPNGASRVVGGVTRLAAKKGFGKEAPQKKPKSEPNPVAVEGKFDTQAGVSFTPPSSEGEFPESSPAAREALKAMRQRKAETAQTSELKVGEFDEVEAELKVNPTAGVIPDKVACHCALCQVSDRARRRRSVSCTALARSSS